MVGDLNDYNYELEQRYVAACLNIAYNTGPRIFGQKYSLEIPKNNFVNIIR